MRLASLFAAGQENLDELTKPLRGQLEELRAQPAMKFLNLERNQITGNLPAYFANFTNLLDLKLSKNKFTGGVLPLEGLAKKLADPVRRINNSIQDRKGFSSKTKAKELMEREVPILFEKILKVLHPNLADGEKLHTNLYGKHWIGVCI